MNLRKQLEPIARKLIDLLREQVPEKSREEIVMSLVLNTASLALEKGQYVEFAPLKGTCGTIQLSGNSLPVFTYTVFEKKIMEFIKVRVEVSKPDRIQYFSQIVSTDEGANGKEVETKEKYKQPFLKLMMHLTQYFPFPSNQGGTKSESVQQKQREEVLV